MPAECGNFLTLADILILVDFLQSHLMFIVFFFLLKIQISNLHKAL